MSESDKLKDMLKRLAGDAERMEDGWRHIESAAGPLSWAVVAEIDETVLPRVLSFRNARGEVLTVEAGHRRLRRFLPPAPEALSPWQRLFGSERLDRLGEVNEIGAALAAHFGDDGEAWVRSAPLAGGEGGAQTGLSAAALLKAWEVAGGTAPGGEIDPAEAVDDFLEKVAQRAAVWAVVSAGAVETAAEGAEALVASAPEVWQSAVGADTAGGPICCVLGRSEGGDCWLVLAGDAERGIVAQLDGWSAAEVAAEWRAVWGWAD